MKLESLYEFCTGCGIQIMVYGDTADPSKLEQMSIYAYVDFESKDPDGKYTLMNIQARSNNRDGMALRIISDRLLKATEKTKLVSDRVLLNRLYPEQSPTCRLPITTGGKLYVYCIKDGLVVYSNLL